jgi:hypothetical protein
MKLHAYVITAPDGSMGVWSTRGFRFVPAPKQDDPATDDLVGMGFDRDEAAPLVAKARTAGIEASADIRRYVMRELMP